MRYALEFFLASFHLVFAPIILPKLKHCSSEDHGCRCHGGLPIPCWTQANVSRSLHRFVVQGEHDCLSLVVYSG